MKCMNEISKKSTNNQQNFFSVFFEAGQTKWITQSKSSNKPIYGIRILVSPLYTPASKETISIETPTPTLLCGTWKVNNFTSFFRYRNTTISRTSYEIPHQTEWI